MHNWYSLKEAPPLPNGCRPMLVRGKAPLVFDSSGGILYAGIVYNTFVVTEQTIDWALTLGFTEWTWLPL